ncbi:LysR family transcriptional regulator [Pseudomonas sp. FFUP_PS_473]|uniref:LysR family transcriptional regulator n=1 Tax=Pseudomonas sp. FFUP_PS_473 TaxID=2060418 RepID=UPI000C7BACCF|nr:LysR family transcriptional regulator [Pseudomonas sp. FFUP_PS_473]PLP95263.1 LysR family transcriptional regulator [Pseudomonas sp. FFUP_PS_473]
MQPILDPKWHHFIKVAKLGSLTHAAVALDVPQSMISRHISQLERDCGVRLFNRTGRGVTLTEFGRQILPRIEALADSSEEISDEIRTSGGVPIGEVRIGLLPSSVEPIVGPLFRVLRDRYPRIRLQICDGSSAHLEELINEGRIDMALLLREADMSNSDETVLVQPKLMLVGRAGDPAVAHATVELSALQGLPLVLPSRPHPLRMRLEKLSKSHGINFDCAVEADSIRLQWEIVAAGGGYAITSGLFEHVNDPRFSVARIVKPELLRSVVLASSLRRPNTLATRTVQKLLAQEAPLLLKNRS